MNEVKKNLARAKRSDIEAMQDRFDDIITVVESIENAALVESLNIIRRIADGASLDSIVREAGRKTLGLIS